MSNIEQLKQLVLGDNFDEEDKQHVIDIEERLHKALVAEKLAEHEVIKDFITYLEGRVEQAEMLLKTDRTLTERERDILFERLDTSNHFLSMFNGKEKEDVETQINKMIDAAKNLQ